MDTEASIEVGKDTKSGRFVAGNKLGVTGYTAEMREEKQKEKRKGNYRKAADKEEREKKLAEEREARRLELKARPNERRARNMNELNNPILKTGTKAQQIDFIIGKFIKQLIEENTGKGLLDVDYTNKEMVTRRKDQMGIIRDHITLIKQLTDVRELLNEEDQSGNKQNLQSVENILLMDEAQDMLAQAGIKITSLH